MNLEELRAPFSHCAQLQRYGDGRGPPDKGFRPGVNEIFTDSAETVVWRHNMGARFGGESKDHGSEFFV
jgi:hypothetical protein